MKSKMHCGYWKILIYINIDAEVSLFRLCYNLIYKNKNKEKETVAMRYIEERCFDMKENKRTISVD